ncbi:candidapepsin-4 precursor [Cordyceps militaris CM01]|uniref:Candidapepsin-4 n=1 Tax=Cordyceps militaris (strain CM01) TaxID=983644 RepID=G3JTB7_CORMM|nr:candidapepsin-4 precursor [Cordyceps militaris CM01]EGX88264.1 candidapepsin-4 precursor [Cordyceps militaris CM01]
MSVSRALLLLLASRALALPREPLEARQVPSGVLHLPLVNMPASPAAGAKLRRQISLSMDQYLYSDNAVAVGAVFDVGTPPQKVILEPDTGSTDLWLLGLQPGQAREGGPGGPASTFFDQNASTSLTALGGPPVSHSFASERITTENYADIFSYGGNAGKSLGNLTMGLGDLTKPGDKLSRQVGVIGLVPSENSADPKSFILERLLDQNLVKSKMFSIGVRKHGHGALTFGGYDTSKFSGPLEKLPMVRSRSNQFYGFALKSISFKKSTSDAPVELYTKGEKGKPLDMGLDSGTVSLHLVKGAPATKVFVDSTGATAGADGKYRFDCAVVDGGASFEFQVTDQVAISMPLADFVETRLDGGKTCQMLIAVSNRMSTNVWAGRQFLRRSYVIHDHEGQTMYVARGADCGSSVVAIDGAMPDGITGTCQREEAEAVEVPPKAPGATTP